MPKPKIIKLNQKNTLHSQCYYENSVIGLYMGIHVSTHNNNELEEVQLSTCGIKFITMIEGSIDVKNNHTGKTETMKNGDSFIVPEDINYQLLKSKDFRAFYLTYSPPAESWLDKPIYDHLVHIDEQDEKPWQKTSDGFNKKLQYESINKKFTSGVWQGGTFKTGMITFPYNEFIFLKSGCLFCTDSEGFEHKINAGEVLFIPQGLSCAWRSQENLSIRFAQIK